MINRFIISTSTVVILLSLVFTTGCNTTSTQSFSTLLNQAQHPQYLVSVNIAATSQWVNTGLNLNTGDRLSITATGSWTPGQDWGTLGPDGSPNPWPDNFLNLQDIGVGPYSATTKTSHYAALIGYIGNSPPAPRSYTSTNIIAESQKVFFVGSNYDANTQYAGTLWLNFNDDAYSGYTDDNAGQVIAHVSVNTLTDAQLIARAQQAAQGKPQPGNVFCVVYANSRGLNISPGGNTGAFNILYDGNDAKLVNEAPTAQLKSEIKPLQNVTDLTAVLHPGDFIVWQRNVARADPTYGHIAVVELVEADRVVISQAAWSPSWKVLHISDLVAGMYGYPRGLP